MRRSTGPYLALASATAFGTLTVSGKYAYGDGVEVPALMAWRFGASAIGIWLIVLLFRRSTTVSAKSAIQLLGVGALLLAPEVTAFFNGLASPGITAGLAEAIFFVYPAWTVWLAGRKVGRAHRFAALAAIGGVALTAGGLESGSTGGVGWLIGASILYALYVWLSGKWLAGVDPWVGSAWMLTGAATALVGRQVIVQSAGPVSLVGWVAVANAVLIGTLLAYALLYAALHRTEAATVAILTTAEPVVAIILGAVLLAERMNPLQALGVFLILGSVVFLLKMEGKDSPSPEVH